MPLAFRSPIQTPNFVNVNFRYYIRFTDGFVSFASGHGPSVNSAGGGCEFAYKFQDSTFSGQIHYDGPTCGSGGPSSFTKEPNQGAFTPLLNNRWYAVELQALLDTVCTNHGTTPWSGCDGTLRAWVDGVLIAEYTGMNLGGEASGGLLKWNLVSAPNAYLHYGVPPWQGGIDFDNAVVSNTGTYIGCANIDGSTGCPGTAENARGTGDVLSPYVASPFTYVGWLGRRAAPDCELQGYLTPSGVLYRSGGALQSGITHGLYTDACVNTVAWLAGSLAGRAVNTLMRVSDGVDANDCIVGGGSTLHMCRWNGSAWVAEAVATDNALEVTLTNASDGGGVYWERDATIVRPQWASYGWIYLPSTNNYTVTNLALVGFAASGSAPASGYVALSVSGGNWSVDQKNTSGTHDALVSGTAVTFDAWHEYELTLWNEAGTGTVSLMIDRVRIYEHEALPLSGLWAFSGTQPFPVIGVIDFQGTPPFTVYYDDQTITTVSAWSADGWGAASCPFL